MAEPVNNCFSTELVYEDSKFNEVGVRRFVEEVNLAGRYIDYAIVSIIGPQSSGKSTLLNHMFGTNFKVMNAQEGRSQATKGIWLAQSPTLGPRYLVVDVEGIDGQERGNDATFEKRSALFALAISDVVILNMWCTNVGLVHGTCQPLLRIVFQVQKKLFTQRKINLIFVLRDKTKTPLDKLKVLLEKDIQKIWNDIADPQECATGALDHRFNIEVVGLSHYRYGEAEFKREVRDLKKLVEDSCTVGGVNPDWTPGSEFVDKAIAIWDKIMENQNLDLPIINESAAMARCGKISSVQYDHFRRDELVEDACTDGGVNPDLNPGSDFIDETITIWDKIMENQDLDLPIINESITMAHSGEISSAQYDNFCRDEVCDSKQLVEDSCTLGGVNPDWTLGSDFVDKTITIWDEIVMENEGLDLPIINESAMVRCNEIFSIQYDNFRGDETWHQIEEAAKSSRVQGFGMKVNQLIGKYLSNFDKETLCCDEIVWNQKRIQLKETMLQVVMPAYHSMLEHISHDSLQSFHEAFENEMIDNSTGFLDVARKCVDNFLTELDNQLQDAFFQESNRSDATILREHLLQHVNDHVDEVRRKNVDDLFRQQRIMLTNELRGPIDSHLRAANEITWVEIRIELESKTQSATVQLLNALSTYELDEETSHNLVQELENHGRNFVRAKVNRAANPRFVVSRMKKRFIEVFLFDSNTTTRVWKDNAEVETAIKTARSSVLKMLSVLAAVRIADHNDTIEEILLYAIHGAHLGRLNLTNWDWEQVIQEDVILQPWRCKFLWNQFVTETEPIVNQVFVEVRKEKWKKYGKIVLGSLAIGGGAVAVANFPVIAAGTARAASAARAAFAASGIGCDVATARTILSGATTAATSTVAYFAWARNLKQLVEDSCTVGGVNLDWIPRSDSIDKTTTIWDKIIMENQDLDLPIINESIAMALCGEISSVQYDSFCRDETWRQIEEAVKSSQVQGFGRLVNELIGKYLSNFDEETFCCDEIVWNQKRIQLKKDMLQVVMPAYHYMLEHIRRDSLQNFHEAFENEMIGNSTGFSNVARKCVDSFLTELDNQLQDAFIQESNWNDATSLREKFLQHINDHVDEVRRKKVDDLIGQLRIMLTNELEGPIDSHLRAANEITWVEIRRELESKTQSATDQLLNALSTYGLGEEMRHNLVQELENHGRNFVRVKASRAANPMSMVFRMKKRFIELFSFDSNTTIRVWEEYAQVEAARRSALSSVVKMLSVMAVVRIVDHNDTTEETLLYAIRDAHLETLNLTNWQQVIQEDVLLQPSTCKDLWNDFLTETTPIVNQALEEVRKKKWKRYARLCLGSLAIGGAVAVANFPVIAAGTAWLLVLPVLFLLLAVLAVMLQLELF